MILAAGRGARMRPLTDKTPKPLLKIQGKPLIEYHIEKLIKAGIQEIVINHAWLGQQIVDTLGSGQRWNIKIHYSPEPNPLETGGGIYNALPLLGQVPFLVVNSDVWCELDYGTMQLPRDKLAHLMMIKNPSHHPQGDFHLDQQHNLTTEGEHKLTYSGIGIYTAEFFKSCQQGRFPLAPLLKKGMLQKKISGFFYQGLWMDIGTPERLNTLNKILL